MEGLTTEQESILRHTRTNGRYCGDSPDMQALVAAGLMCSLGRVSWCPDEYFGLTSAGRDWLRTHARQRAPWEPAERFMG